MDYRTDGTARAAAVLFHDWPAAAPAHDLVQRVENVEPYEPGAFYKRGLPCLLAVLTEAAKLGPLVTVVIDGYVTLDAAGRGGLGRYVFGALGERIPVIGVAKTAFEGATHALPLLRGESRAPLLVTAAGLDAQDTRSAGTHSADARAVPRSCTAETGGWVVSGGRVEGLRLLFF